MKQGQAKVVHLKEYQVPNYLAETVHLNVDLNDAETIVTSTVKYSVIVNIHKRVLCS